MQVYPQHQFETLRRELQSQITATDFDIRSNRLDDSLTKYIVLRNILQQKDFASHSSEHSCLARKLLDSPDVMKEMVWNDGAKNGRYVEAYHIFCQILQQIESRKDEGSGKRDASNDIYKRLAMAISLEHAEPVKQQNAAEAVDANEFVDPVKRFLHFADAYDDGELDPDFEILTTWELRFVVDSDEPDKIYSWGRRTMRNFQPRHMWLAQDWRYVAIVRSDISYGSQNVKKDEDKLHLYQNILMNGGICGRRAFIGRFFLRSFGIPTTARPSKGHGALCHWTREKGWVVNLGPGWGSGWTKTCYHNDLDFLETTRARKATDYWQVKRAQWIGEVMGESAVYGVRDQNIENAGYWYKHAMELQTELLANESSFEGENHPPRQKQTIADTIAQTSVASVHSKICYKEDGAILIPSTAYETPRKVKDVQISKSFLSGMQVYLPPFQAQGLTILRGGTWKDGPDRCCSGYRMLSGGYGKYNNWGFRVALTAGSGSCPPEISLDLGSNIALDMRYIAPGACIMGGDNTKEGRFACVEVPHHRVELTEGFYIGTYPVTQSQYEAIMGTNPSKSTKGLDHPVDNIGEEDARDFCQAYVDKYGKDLRLPSEAEWEYAVRAGTTTKHFFGDDPSVLREYAWFKDNAGMKSHPVGQLKPNPWGLYDVYGSVSERVNDKYERSYYEIGPKVDPTGPLSGTKSKFEFKVKIPCDGKYKITAKVVTVNYNQNLMISTNVSETKHRIELPHTLGDWDVTAPIVLDLVEGENILRFWREQPPQKGIVIKNFTLSPIN